MIVLGLDPSLSGFGYGLIEVGHTQRVVRAGVWVTWSDRVLKGATEDNADRIAFLAKSLWDFASENRPDRIFVEGTILPFGKSAWNASLLGRCRGLVDTLGAALGVEVIELSPQAVKKGLGIVLVRGPSKRRGFDVATDGGRLRFVKSPKEKPAMASKQEVRDRIEQLYPEAVDLIPNGKIGENSADAIAVAHVGISQTAFTDRLRPSDE